MHLKRKPPMILVCHKAMMVIVMIAVLCAALSGCTPGPDSTHPSLNHYTVTFYDWDGAVLKTENVEHGKSATPPEVPGREGYVFVDWDINYDCVTSDLSVTATYSTITVPTILADSVTVNKKSGTVDVAIRVLNNPGISSLKFTVEYSNVLILEDVKLSTAFGPYLTTPTPYSNPLVITLISPLEDTNVNGVLATLTFRFPVEITVDTAEVKIVLSEKEIFNADFNAVKFEHMDGKITIQDI